MTRATDIATNAVTNPDEQTPNEHFSTGLTWQRSTGFGRLAAYAVLAIVLNFAVITAVSYDYAASSIA